MKQLFVVILLVLGFQIVNAGKRPKNIILLVGNGMGLSQLYAGMTAKGTPLNIERCTSSGYLKTYSYQKYTTDLGAAATAIACGVKTKNGMIGMSPDSIPISSILDDLGHNGFRTGIVVTSTVTHATPASFYTHQAERNNDEVIANDLLKSNIDVIIGGGRKYFEKRDDGINLTHSFQQKDYQIVNKLEELELVRQGKLLGLLYDDQPPSLPDRGAMLPKSTQTAINILSKNKKGFFLFIEGSQIDWANHDNRVDMVIKEMLDFDNAIGLALDYAEKDKNTLVIVTGNYETGGLTLLDGSFGNENLKVAFLSKNHTGIPVPIFAYGPGASLFSGFMENNEIKSKIESLIKLSITN